MMVRLRVAEYASGSVMAPHSHAEMSFSVIIRGRYVERIAGREVEHGPGHMLLYPAQEMHSQRFGAGGVRQVIFTPDADTLDSLHECGISAERPSARVRVADRAVGCAALERSGARRRLRPVCGGGSGVGAGCAVRPTEAPGWRAAVMARRGARSSGRFLGSVTYSRGDCCARRATSRPPRERVPSILRSVDRRVPPSRAPAPR